MKAKLSIDKNAIKNFSIDHAEKVIFGFVLLGVMMIIYSAVGGREKTDKKPEQLLAKVIDAKSNIEKSHDVEKQAGDIDKVTEMSHDLIKVDPYQLTKAICPPVGKLDHPRGEPPVLEVEKLSVATGSGMFQIAPKTERAGAGGREPAATTGSDQRGQRWAVITGLVPFKKQSDAYLDAFRDCKTVNAAKDTMPEYQGYLVERLEITSPGDIKNPNWNNSKKVTKFSFKTEKNKATKDWGASMQPEPVDQKYLNAFLCFPVGPLLDGTWGVEVAHAPEIPLISAAWASPAVPTADATPDKKPAEPEGEFGDQTAAAGPAGVAGGGMPGPGAPMGMQGGIMPNMGYGGGGRGAPGMGQGRMQMDVTGVDYLLFRFFDFTVEPGKRYIYRAQLALTNPNFGLKPILLEKPELAQSKFLVQKDWSKPSPPISIPNDISTLALAVEQPRRLSGDPLGSMMVASWQQDSGLKVYNEFAVERGQLLNFLDAEVEAVQRRSGTAIANRPDKTALLSNVLVVDMAGGKKLPTLKPKQPEEATDQFNKKLPPKGKDKAIISPGEILVMEPDGTLVVRNEFDDMATVDTYTSAPAQPAPGIMPPGMRGMPPGYGGPGMQGYGPGMQGGPGMFGGPGMQGYGPAPRGGAPAGGQPGYGNLFGQPAGKQTPTPKK